MYPAARAVAEEIATRFQRKAASTLVSGYEELAPLPGAPVVERMVDVAFWASLRREEGLSPRISLAYVPPDAASRPLIFERALPLSPSTLVKLAPAVERPGIHLGVWHHGDELQLWGATRTIPNLCFVLEVVEPGLLVIKYRRGLEYGKFGNVAVLRGDEVQLVDESGAGLPDCAELSEALAGFGSPASWGGSADVLVQLAVSMRAHGRGGLLLLVPSETDHWKQSIVHPIAYSIAPSFTNLARLVREGAMDDSPAWQDALRRSVDGVAGVTAVDGATVITEQYELLAFGAKIGRREGSPPVERIVVTEPVVGNIAQIASPGHIGGTRHLSAAQFVHDQKDAVALVASQDGRFTIFAWSRCDEVVYAHRVESLLL